MFEPSPRNWSLLVKNVSANHFEDRIHLVHKAVTDGKDVMMNVDVSDREQARVSAYGPGGLARTTIPGVTLANIIKDYEIDVIDLLKIDCEGGEYAILLTTPTEVFRCIRNIVFEYHEIDGFEAKLGAVKEKLCEQGYSLQTRGNLISASRS